MRFFVSLLSHFFSISQPQKKGSLLIETSFRMNKLKKKASDRSDGGMTLSQLVIAAENGDHYRN